MLICQAYSIRSKRYLITHLHLVTVHYQLFVMEYAQLEISLVNSCHGAKISMGSHKAMRMWSWEAERGREDAEKDIDFIGY
jgi:hypothetical protein